MRVQDLDQIDEPTRQQLLADGFGVVERLVDDATLDQLRGAYDDIIEGRVLARGDRLLGDVIRQVKHPSKDHPVFAANAALEAGCRLAERLFAREGFTKVYEMLIDKPAGTVHETPWHQDAGYFGRPVAEPGTPTGFPDIQVWLALDPVDVDNGCMQFLPAPHGQPSLPHHIVSGDPDDEGRLIAVSDEVDGSAAVACPLEPGGATFHFPGTPHYTGPNRTDRPRRAYIFNIGPKRFAESAEAALEAEWGDTALLS